MGSIVQTLLFKDRTFDAVICEIDETDIKGIPVTSIEGEKLFLGDLIKGFKLTVIVNVASKWAFAHKSYVELVNVYDEYKPFGVQLIAFPSD